MTTSWLEKMSKKIIHPDKLSVYAKRIRAEKRSIATLNGAFDLLHPGHLYMISEAKTQADTLFILLNSDATIKATKGDNRPYCDLKQRLLMVAALPYVTYASWFDEVEPSSILESIKPDVHVNGEEYGHDCIEATAVKKHGGRIFLVPRIGDFSTSKILDS